jgi:hypothetical protein
MLKSILKTYKVPCSIPEHSDHLVGSVNACHCCLVIARALHTMLPHHVHHLEMPGQDRLVMLKELKSNQYDARTAIDRILHTSGQGMCLAGRGPEIVPPVHRF